MQPIHPFLFPEPAPRRSRLEKVAAVIWCDVESTGTDPNTCLLLEICTQSASPQNPLTAFGPARTAQFQIEPLMEVPRFRADIGIHPVVEEMHTRNGLWRACAAPTATTLAEYDDYLHALYALPKVMWDAGHRYMLAGLSPAALDLPLIKLCLPRFGALLGHRVLDVSTLLVQAEQLGYAPIEGPAGNSAHRAGDDVAYAQEMYLRCRDTVGTRRGYWDRLWDALAGVGL